MANLGVLFAKASASLNGVFSVTAAEKLLKGHPESCVHSGHRRPTVITRDTLRFYWVLWLNANYAKCMRDFTESKFF